MTELTPLFEPDFDNPWLRKAVALREIFAADAAERDRQGGRPWRQIELLKQENLLTITVPREQGGPGEPISTVHRIGREFAKVDGSLGHIYGYHFSTLTGFALAGPDVKEAQDWLMRSLAGNWFWGNTANSFSRTLFAEQDGEWFTVNGFKPFASGTHVADYFMVAWQNEQTGERTIAAIPADTDGITVHHDWDGLGQTQTGSGRVSYSDVRVHQSQVIGAWGDPSQPIRSLGAQGQQTVLLNVFIGSAQGALIEVQRLLADRVVTDAQRRRFAELYARVLAATALADKASDSLDRAYARGHALTETERGRTAIDCAAANVLAGEVALEVTSGVYEILGPDADLVPGLDRFWRNVRVHTLHNPAEYKTLIVGDWALEGTFPAPALFQ